MLKKPGDDKFVSVDLSRHLVPNDSEAMIHAGSGGGWGDPLARDTERVQWDVIEGLVSAESARKHYGVVLNPDESIDQAATAALRKEMASQRAHA